MQKIYTVIGGDVCPKSLYSNLNNDYYLKATDRTEVLPFYDEFPNVRVAVRYMALSRVAELNDKLTLNVEGTIVDVKNVHEVKICGNQVKKVIVVISDQR